MIPEPVIIGLLKVCPEIQQRWNDYIRWMVAAGNPRTTGTDALTIAMFVDASYKARQTHIFPRLFAFAEQMLDEGDAETQMAIDQILKQIRMSLVTRMNGPNLYVTWMGPKTKQRWHSIDSELAETNPKIAGKPRRRIKPERLREYKVTLTRCNPNEQSIPPDYHETMGAGTATKLGGNPNWLQSDERPNCCCCNQPMTFVAQIDSIEHIGITQSAELDDQRRSSLRKDQQWMFGDVGMIYVYFCFDCFQTQSVFQCH